MTVEPQLEPQLKTAIKYDTNKPMMSLLEPETLIGIAKVFTYGANKYAPYNYHKGMDSYRLYDALLRHLNAYWAGEDIDQESGYPHLHHAGCCLMMLDWTHTHRPDLDSRPKQSVANVSKSE